MSTIDARREAIAAELGIPIDKVTVCPYKPPKGHTKGATPWETAIRNKLESTARLMKCAPCNVTIHYHHGYYCGKDFYENTNPKNPDIMNIVRRNIGGLQDE